MIPTPSKLNTIREEHRAKVEQKGWRAKSLGIIRKGILEGYYLRQTLNDRKKFDRLWQQ